MPGLDFRVSCINQFTLQGTITYPTNGKGNSSFQLPLKGISLSSLDGKGIILGKAKSIPGQNFFRIPTIKYRVGGDTHQYTVHLVVSRVQRTPPYLEMLASESVTITNCKLQTA